MLVSSLIASFGFQVDTSALRKVDDAVDKARAKLDTLNVKSVGPSITAPTIKTGLGASVATPAIKGGVVGDLAGPLTAASAAASKLAKEDLPKVGDAAHGVGDGFARFYENSSKSIEGVISKIKALGAGLLAFQLIRKGFSLAEEMGREAEAIEETAARLNMTNEAYQQFIAAGTLAGVRTDQLAGKMMWFERTLALAAEQGGKGAEKLEQLGIAFRNQDGSARDSMEVLLQVSDRIKGTASHTEKLALVTSLFGRGGASMLRFLEIGSADIKRLGAEAKATGGLMSEETFEALQKNEIEAAKFDLALKSLRNTLVNYLLPGINWMFAKGKVLADGLVWLATKTHVFEAIALILGAVTLVKLASSLGSVTSAIKLLLSSWKMNVILVAVVAAILVIDDFLALLSGGRSVIGTFLDKMFGFGTAADYVQILHEEWRAFSDFFLKTIPEIGAGIKDFLVNPLEGITDIIDGILGSVASLYRGLGMTTLADAMDKQLAKAQTARHPVNVEPGTGPLENPTAPSFRYLANPTAGPTQEPAMGRAAAPGLLSPLVDESNKDFGRGVFASDRVRQHQQANEEKVVKQSLISKAETSNVTNVSAPAHVNVTVQAQGGHVSKESLKALDEAIDRGLVKHGENLRRALRHAS